MRFLPVAVLLVTCPPASAAELTHEQALAAMRRATGFFQDQLAAGNGAYLWQYAADLKERELPRKPILLCNGTVRKKSNGNLVFVVKAGPLL